MGRRAARRRAAHGVGHALLVDGRLGGLDRGGPQDVRRRDGPVDELRQVRRPGATDLGGQHPVGRIPADQPPRHGLG